MSRRKLKIHPTYRSLTTTEQTVRRVGNFTYRVHRTTRSAMAPVHAANGAAYRNATKRRTFDPG